MNWNIEYYAKENGEIPVLEFLLSLEPKMGAKVKHITRVFYFTFQGNKFVLLHGIKKKTQKTPPGELERALRYKEDFERRSDNG